MLRFTLFLLLNVLVLSVSAESSDSSSSEESAEKGNDTVPQDLYVIKTVVYEVGILTDAGNQTDTNDTVEQVDVTFYDPKLNGSAFDLSNIPVPIETNVSGVSVTGILPTNLGSLLVPPNGSANLDTSIPLLPNQQIKVTHNVSTVNPEKGNQILSSLSNVLGIGALQNATQKKEQS